MWAACVWTTCVWAACVWTTCVWAACVGGGCVCVCVGCVRVCVGAAWGRVTAYARSIGAVVILDCVTSLSGSVIRLDDWNVDAAYSGTQKCLAVPPGLSPVR